MRLLLVTMGNLQTGPSRAILDAGEIVCGYASGCLTREQTLQVAYQRGRLPVKYTLKGGLMVATGLSAIDAAKKVQGTQCVVACDNSPSSTTLSGLPICACHQPFSCFPNFNIVACALLHHPFCQGGLHRLWAFLNKH